MIIRKLNKYIIPLTMLIIAGINLGSFSEFIRILVDGLPYYLLLVFALNFNKIIDKLPTKYNVDQVDEAKTKSTYL